MINPTTFDWCRMRAVGSVLSLQRRSLCTVSARVAARSDFWKKMQMTNSDLEAQLDAAREGTQEERGALAVQLARRWDVVQISATKQETNVATTFALQVDGARIGLLRASIWPEGKDGFKTAVLSGMHCDPALPLGLAAYPLIQQARSELTKDAVGVQRIMSIASLPGLCPWMIEERSWEKIDDIENIQGGEYSLEEQRAAVEAIARGMPTGGRDSLDEETYLAAEAAFKGIALTYAALEDVEEESTAMALAGGRLVGIHYRHDRAEEAMHTSAGCTASYEFDTEEVKHIDLDDKIADHAATNPHAAEGFPGRW